MAALNILIVGDDAGNRKLVRLALLTQAYECMVEEADSAEAMFEKLALDAGRAMSRAVLKFARQASLSEQATRPWRAVQDRG